MHLQDHCYRGSAVECDGMRCKLWKYVTERTMQMLLPFNSV